MSYTNEGASQKWNEKMSERLWKQDKGKGVYVSRGSKLREDKYMGETNGR